ncbi:hypothetical protein XENORESO_008706, partial [Xenotaenia resolanae]
CYQAGFEGPDGNPRRAPLAQKGKRHLSLFTYIFSGWLFTASAERRHYVPLYAQVQSKSTHCEIINV